MAIWIIVGDASRARLFKAEERNSPLEEIADYTHPASRLHEGDLVSDGEGSLKGPGDTAEMADEPDHKQGEARQFALQITTELARGVTAGDCSSIYWIAPPRFLGLLRETASAAVRDKVKGELDKDLSKHSAEDIRAHLPAHL